MYSSRLFLPHVHHVVISDSGNLKKKKLDALQGLNVPTNFCENLSAVY